MTASPSVLMAGRQGMSLILPGMYVAAAFLVQLGLVGSVGICDRGRRRCAPRAAILASVEGRMPNVPGTAIRRLGSYMSSLDNACLALKEIRFCPLRSALMQCSGVGADVCCS